MKRKSNLPSGGDGTSGRGVRILSGDHPGLVVMGNNIHTLIFTNKDEEKYEK